MPSLTGLRGLIAPIVAIAVVGLSLSLSYPLFGLLLEQMGTPGWAIGLNTTAASSAIVIAAPILPRIFARIGMARVLIGGQVVLVAIMLLAPLWHNIWWWAGLRMIAGFAATAIFFATEYWIVAKAPEGTRGRVVAIYAITLSASFMVGPLILSAVGFDGIWSFVVAAAIMALGFAPVLWGLSAAPPAEEGAPPRPADTLRFFVTDPSLLFGVILFGVIEYGVVGLLGVWGIRAGLDARTAVLLLAAFGLGSVLCQWPVGWLADRTDRRVLLAVAAAVAVLAPALMIAVSPAFWPLAVLTVIWGGLAIALYSVALVELGARYTGARLVEATAAVLLGYGLGAVLSPALFGLAMDLIPPDGLLIAASLSAAAYLALILVRLRRRPAAPRAPGGA